MGVVDFMRAMTENVGAPLLTPRLGEASTTWQLLYQFSARRRPAAISPVSWATAGTVASKYGNDHRRQGDHVVRHLWSSIMALAAKTQVLSQVHCECGRLNYQDGW